MAGDTCDVCGGKDYIAGVAASPLGPMSKCYCSICLGMNAEEKWMIDFVFETNNFRAMAGKEAYIYYDKVTDCYKNYGTGEIESIKFKSGESFATKEAAVKHIKAKQGK